MAFVVPMGAVAVAGLSAYGLWRHTTREESESAGELDTEQERGDNGTRAGVLHGITQLDITNYFGKAAHDFLLSLDWVDLQTSDDPAPIMFAGAPTTKADLSRLNGLQVMNAVNAFATAGGGTSPYNFNAPLPPFTKPKLEVSA